MSALKFLQKYSLDLKGSENIKIVAEGEENVDIHMYNNRKYKNIKFKKEIKYKNDFFLIL